MDIKGLFWNNTLTGHPTIPITVRKFQIEIAISLLLNKKNCKFNYMQKLLTNLVDGLYTLFAGHPGGEDEQITFKEKLRVTLIWLATIIFCILMLKLLIR